MADEISGGGGNMKVFVVWNSQYDEDSINSVFLLREHAELKRTQLDAAVEFGDNGARIEEFELQGYERIWLEGAVEMYLDVQKTFPLTAPAYVYAQQLLKNARGEK